MLGYKPENTPINPNLKLQVHSIFPIKVDTNV